VTMALFIDRPVIVSAAGNKPKMIEEYFGRVSTGAGDLSVARMKSPLGWEEPGQCPDFDEYTVVVRGILRVTVRDRPFEVMEGQAVLVHRGEWVRYSTPHEGGAEYISVCLPAFSTEIVHRDDAGTAGA
jgi:mannose-6-phosphate isomerase-like protein (cupin superfamily)